MARKFNKTITTPEAQALYDRLQAHKEQRKALCSEIDKAEIEWHRFNGKYAIGTVNNPYCGVGQCGWFYQYASPEDERREQEEQDKFNEEVIKPLYEKLRALDKEGDDLEEQLCIALWGYGLNEYYLRRRIIAEEKELAEQIRKIEEKKAEIEAMKAELKKISAED